MGYDAGGWERSPQTPEANGCLGAKPPAAGGWEQSLQSPKARGFGGGSPSAQRFFNKNNAFLGVIGLNFCFKNALTIAEKG